MTQQTQDQFRIKCHQWPFWVKPVKHGPPSIKFQNITQVQVLPQYPVSVPMLSAKLFLFCKQSFEGLARLYFEVRNYKTVVSLKFSRQREFRFRTLSEVLERTEERAKTKWKSFIRRDVMSYRTSADCFLPKFLPYRIPGVNTFQPIGALYWCIKNKHIFRHFRWKPKHL